MPRPSEGRSPPAESDPSRISPARCSASSLKVTDESQNGVVRRRKTGVVYCPGEMPALVSDMTSDPFLSDSLVGGGGPIVSSLPSDQKIHPAPPAASDQPGISSLGSVYGFKSSNIEMVLNGLTLGEDNGKRPANERSKSFSGILNQVCEEEFGSVTRASSLHTLSGYAISRPPKLTNPQVIEQHISKIISENAAIVETLDPLWSKRYMRHNGESKSRRMSEGASMFPSKLHSALLGKCDERRSPLRESVVKNLTCAQGIPEEPYKQHPNNPEGSIIKDLLLKARAQQKEESEALEIEPGQVVYTCALCSITFRSRENLDVHQSHYCKGSRSSPSIVAINKRSSSFSYPGFFPREEGGQILKKQLLGSPRADEPNSPNKKRKISEPVFPNGPSTISTHSDGCLPRERRFTFNNLFWQKGPVSSSATSSDSQDSGRVVVTIANTVLNSGGAIVCPASNHFSTVPTEAQSPINVSLPAEKPSELPSRSDTALVVSIPGEPNNKMHMTVPEVHLTPSSPDPLVSDSRCFQSDDTQESTKSNYLSPVRPTSLPLKKKAMTMEYSTLVSPETPRPKRNCIQLYLNGQAYTSLYLKCSTRTTYCCLRPPQPMYVVHQPKLSMYSNWQVQPARNEFPDLAPCQVMGLYQSRRQEPMRASVTTSAASKAPLVSTHSSYWTFRRHDEEATGEAEKVEDKLQDSSESTSATAVGAPRDEGGPEDERSDIGMGKDSSRQEKATEKQSPLESSDNLPEGDSDVSEGGTSEDSGSESQRGDKPTRTTTKRVRIFQGGYKSNEDYTYIRGRGRGKYVCEECGIRCKKPSMLKKHIRTHTDLRPYSCSHCSFAFKTKGNLTKHMKSKAHHKKCLELGIVPVPTVIDDSQIDEAAVAQQVAKRQQFLDAGGIEDDDEDEDDEFDDEEEDEEESEFEDEEKEETDSRKDHKEPETSKSDMACTTAPRTQPKGQFEDAPFTTCSEIPVTSISVIASTRRSATPVSPPGAQVRETDQEAEAARSLLNLSDSWMVQTQPETEKMDHETLSRDLSASSNSIASIPTSHWSEEEDAGPRSRPRSYSVNVPPSRDPHTKVISYAMPPASQDSTREGTSRRYSMSSLSESKRVMNCPTSSAMYGHTTSEKHTNPKSNYDKHWHNGIGEQPMDLRVVKVPRLMLLDTEPALWTNSTIMLSPVTERPPRSTVLEGNSYQFSDSSVPTTEYASRFSPGVVERVPRDIFPVKEVEEVNGDIAETAASPDAPEYSALSPISPASADGDSQACQPAVEDASSVLMMDNNAAMTSRLHAAYARMNNSKMDEGKSVCSICNKVFSKPSQLRLHVNIHYFERPFRCESCAVSFRTKGHLQKHKRSVSHYNKVNMNMTFGTPTTDNPRPFKCGDCKIAFRIHGHLAKHLRSKMHIMKLECLGKLPFGMYAEMERSGVNLNEIDTTDCENSLESLQVMAHRLYQQDPRRMRWQSDQQSTATSKDDRPLLSPAATTTTTPVHISTDESLGSPPTPTRLPQVSTPTAPVTPNLEPCAKVPLKVHEVKLEASEEDILRLVQRVQQEDYCPQPSKITATDLSRIVTVEKELEIPVLHRSCTCHLCGRVFKSIKFLQVHLHYEHQSWSGSSGSGVDLVSGVGTLEEPQPHWVSPLECNQRLLGGSATVVESLECEICGRQFASRSVLQQHLLSHAQPRPFVCEVCDAGFTSSVMLSSHLATHPQEKPYMCHECGTTFAVVADFQRHMQAHLNDTT